MAVLCARARPHDDSGVSVQCCRIFGVRSLPQLVQQAFIAENTCIIQAFLPLTTGSGSCWTSLVFRPSAPEPFTAKGWRLAPQQ